MKSFFKFASVFGHWTGLVAILMLMLGSEQRTSAQTTILVTTTQQGVTDPTHCSLQEAIYAAEFASNTALNLTDPDSFYTSGCVLQGASGPFTIVLQKTVYAFNTFWDRDAHNPFGLTATPIIFTNMTIQGNGATLQWTGKGNSRLFAVGSASIFDTLDNKTVSGTGALRLEAVYIKGFIIKGGDGACGGAGGLGAGGAIFVGKVDSGVPTLDVEDSTFDSNFATGGNGSNSGCLSDSFRPAGAGGGGGGLSGNGGGTGTGGGGGGGGGSRGSGGSGGIAARRRRRRWHHLRWWRQHRHGGQSRRIPLRWLGRRHVESMAMMPLAPVAAAVEEERRMGVSSATSMDPMEPMAPTAAVAPEAASATVEGAAVVATADLAEAVAPQERTGPSSAAVAEEMVDLAEAVLSASEPTSIAHGAPGSGGAFGGSGNGSCCGGGGGALGGAIFNDSGTVFVRNSTFTGNDVDRGEGGVNDAGTDRASRGADAGAAIFSLNGSLVLDNTTISGNFVTGSDNAAGGGVVGSEWSGIRGASLNCLTLSFLETGPTTAY